MDQSNITKIPVLLIAFNRPDTTARVLDAVALYKPEVLYVSIDGERENNTDDRTRIAEVVALITEWEKNNPDTVVHTLFQPVNLGCGVAPSTAINWFFKNEEWGIILEDDCVPKQSFFSLCQQLLPYYADNEKVFGISGTNLQAGINRGSAAYYFSKYSVIWGWASWARAWKKYSYEMEGFDEFIKEDKLATVFNTTQEKAYWQTTLEKASKLGSWWDYQLLYTLWRNNGSFIVPNVNLVNNIGFSTTGTHTLKEPSWYKELINNDKELPVITHPENTTVNEEADHFLFTRAYNPKKRFAALRKLFKKYRK